MSVWERERVLALTPLPSARTAARELALPGRWTSSGATSRAVWGECLGSAGTTYQTAVELTEPAAYSCSCPSRRSPCKHAVGLLLLWSGGGVPTRPDEPEAVAGWLDRRSPGSPRADEPAGLVDPNAAARRAAARVERVSAGLEDLDLWLRDQIRGGLAGLERVGYAHFERVAARMVDAQAPGVAGMLRAISIELAGDGWPERVLERLAALHLLIQAHRRLPELPSEIAANVRSRVGYPVTKAQVLASPGVPDHWLALGMVDTVESQLETRRVWLYGADSGRWALWLSFAVPGAALDATVLPGQQLDATLHFYPGSGFRALIGESTPGPASTAEVSSGTLAAAQRRFASLLAVDPWAGRLPCTVTGSVIQPGESGGPWRLRDVDGHCVDLVGMTGEPWPMLARSGGLPIEVFGEWSVGGFLPLSMLADRNDLFSTGVST
ncbi:MAG TPA: SWIM zinc finger family protein [Propionibacteriaceae bacterium]|nr:SWIM zinc finger family protein [Propionibacteriaceae bacterium]